MNIITISGVKKCEKSEGPSIQYPSVIDKKSEPFVEIEYDTDRIECSETECDQQMTTDQIHTSIDKIENDLSDLIDSLSDFDTHEMENRTQSSINSFQTEFLKKSQFPILVKALVSSQN